jgi:magnesium transporter
MSVNSITASASIEALNRAFLLNYPRDAARKIESLPASEAADLLQAQPIYMILPAWSYLSPGVADRVLTHLSDATVSVLLPAMEAGLCAALLGRLDASQQSRYFALLDKRVVEELQELLAYPVDSAGHLMATDIIACNENLTVTEALTQLRNQKKVELHHLFLLNDDMHLIGEVAIQKLALADGSQMLGELASPIRMRVNALDPKSEVMDLLEKLRVDTLPVIDGNERFVGVISSEILLGVMKETLAMEMLTMVGVSKDERALSSTWFAVKKRLPWLQINLLTAFMASAVVSMFESTIAQYTALAILLPIAAGQSGNTGAQALAVTMRGLTLREITVRHWLRVTLKEAGAGLINGLATAVTCGAGVYLWSGSTGLALIIALAMITSMVIAAVAGALVPMALKRLGQDPALSSSIILTTVTDIAGFMSFLGIATLLSGMLVEG